MQSLVPCNVFQSIKGMKCRSGEGVHMLIVCFTTLAIVKTPLSCISSATPTVLLAVLYSKAYSSDKPK